MSKLNGHDLALEIPSKTNPSLTSLVLAKGSVYGAHFGQFAQHQPILNTPGKRYASLPTSTNG